MDDDLIAFVTARLDEDEWMANVALGSLPSYPLEPLRDRAGERLPEQYAAHIGRHDPARVLREVEAGRVILQGWRLASEGTHSTEYLKTLWLYRAICAMAAVWSDHPDYRAEWKP